MLTQYNPMRPAGPPLCMLPLTSTQPFCSQTSKSNTSFSLASLCSVHEYPCNSMLWGSALCPPLHQHARAPQHASSFQSPPRAWPQPSPPPRAWPSAFLVPWAPSPPSLDAGPVLPRPGRELCQTPGRGMHGGEHGGAALASRGRHKLRRERFGIGA